MCEAAVMSGHTYTHTHIHTYTHDNYYNPRCAHAHRGLMKVATPTHCPHMIVLLPSSTPWPLSVFLRANHSSLGIFPGECGQYLCPRNWVWPSDIIGWWHTLQLYIRLPQFFWCTFLLSSLLHVPPHCCS